MPDNELPLTVVVNGQSVVVDANENAPLETIVPKALSESQNTGQPPQNWELRDSAGNLLNLQQKVRDYGFMSGTTLYLSLKAGIGG